MQDVKVVIIGAGAAGLAAGRHLHDAGVPVVVLEARSRRGGRSWTVTDLAPYPIDMGCHWLHSGDRNPWREIAEATGFTVDRTPAPWGTQALDLGFPPADQDAFRAAHEAFHNRIAIAARAGPDRPALTLLAPGNRWNALIDAISTYANGAALADVSVVDLDRSADTNTNWRVREGYGALIADWSRTVPVMLDCPVTTVDHRGKRIRVASARGTIEADAVIVTVPTSLLATGTIRFDPPLPEKQAAAAGLPLGIANKVTLAFENTQLLASDSHLFARLDRIDTGSYHIRPLGRPAIEGYFGGALAVDLEQQGPAAFAAFAIEELASLVGNDIRRQLVALSSTAWHADPLARGSYSHALPGQADQRSVLAATVSGRLFFAGEACSTTDYSTAHGAYMTGLEAATGIISTMARE